jgi:hypothetical protein
MGIHKVITFSCPPEKLWEIVGTPDRVDWVPGVEGCEFDGETRSLKLPGAGQIKEKILSHEPDAFSMSYSCIESPVPLQKHLASIKINTTDEGCEMHWKTDVEPAAFESFIEESMDGAIERLHALLD